LIAHYRPIAVKVVTNSIAPHLWKARAAAMVDRWCVFLIDPYPTQLSDL
jgi:hypothetical protein